MPQTDKRIDAYILKSAPFAQPILEHLRAIIHKACPDVQETMKWNMPHFDYKGDRMCFMASFKGHCAFGLWKAPLMKDKETLAANNKLGMGHLGKISSLNDFPPAKVLMVYIKEAMKLNEQGVKIPVKASTGKKTVVVPGDFKKALLKNKLAAQSFANFSYSHRKEYVNWINEAKTEATRYRRITTAVAWISNGKVKDWKYIKK